MYKVDLVKIVEVLNEDNKIGLYSLDAISECTLLNDDKAAPRDAPGVYTLTLKLKLVKQ